VTDYTAALFAIVRATSPSARLTVPVATKAVRPTCARHSTRWVNPSQGYVGSQSKLSRFEKLYAEGYGATCAGELVAPKAPLLG
jgi:hypothetical protein